MIAQFFDYERPLTTKGTKAQGDAAIKPMLPRLAMKLGGVAKPNSEYGPESSTSTAILSTRKNQKTKAKNPYEPSFEPKCLRGRLLMAGALARTR